MIDETEDGKKNSIAKDGKTIYKPMETKIIQAMDKKIIKPMKKNIIYPIGTDKPIVKDANETKDTNKTVKTEKDDIFIPSSGINKDKNVSIDINIDNNSSSFKESNNSKSIKPINLE